MSPGMVKSLMWQLLNGINYLHQNWVIHRDLKPCNVLVMGQGKDVGRVRIADLGLARIFQAPLRPLCDNGLVVTIWYRAPEILLGSKHYTKAIDMWAMGCIFAEMMICQPLFQGNEKKGAEFQSDQLSKIASWCGRLTPEIWPDCVKLPFWSKLQEQPFADNTLSRSNIELQISKMYGQAALDLLNSMLQYNPATRISAKDALQDPYFSQTPQLTINVFDYEPEWETFYPHRSTKNIQSKGHENDQAKK